MSQQDILNCSFPLWFGQFQKDTIDTITLKIPKIYVDYLLGDGLFLPDSHPAKEDDSDEEILRNSNEEDVDLHVITDEEAKSKKMFLNEEFVKFQSHVVSAIEELGGMVFPKLNWSSPKDATWIAVNGSLCCQTFNDICLLLKSSEFITHDLTDPFMMSQHVNSDSSDLPTVQYVLVLRKWLDISPSGEYRCFIKDGQLLAISQRGTQYFNFIESQRHDIVRSIQHFFHNHVKAKFPNSSYVLDLYIPGDNARPIIIDFNPYVTITDSLLFTWDELEENVPLPEITEGDLTRGIAFRSVPREGVVSTHIRNAAFPIDFQHLATGEDPAKLIDLLKLHQRSSTSNDSTDSD